MTSERPDHKESFIQVDENLLTAYGIDPSLWGTGTYKTIDHLNAELAAGEASLIAENGQLIRFTRILGIDVCCYIDGEMRVLHEVRQEFNDGRTRSRNLPTSLGEKLTPEEEAAAGIERALKEELGLTSVLNIGSLGDQTHERDSPSFPGIVTRSVIHNYAVLIDPAEYSPGGYAEHQTDKSTYFEWI